MIKQTPMVAAEAVEALQEYLLDHDMPIADFLKAESLPLTGWLEEPFVPFTVFSRLFDYAEYQLADTYVGLHVGQSVAPRHWGQLGYLILAGEDGFEGVRYIERYARLITDAMETRFDIEDGLLICQFTMAKDYWHRQTLEYFLAAIHTLGVRMSDGQFRFQELHLAYDPDLDVAQYEQVFGCPVYFGRAGNRILVQKSALTFSSSFRDPRLKKLLEQNASQVLQQVAGEDDLVRAVKATISEALAQGLPGLAETATTLGLNERSLQRNLARQGTSFQELLDQVRSELALHYIQQDVSLLDIALLLGYSEQSAFHRAFKRWTGIPPSRFRRDGVAST